MREKIQKRILDKLISTDTDRTRVIDVSPRVGKTKPTIDYLKLKDKGKVLITVPYNTIIDSWHDEFKKWDYEFTGDIINKVSLYKINVQDYDFIIIDEIHDLSENQLNAIVNHKQLLGLSGSINDETLITLKSKLKGLEIIYKYTVDQAVNDNIVADYEIRVVTLPLDRKDKYLTAGTKKKPFKSTEFAQYEYLSKQFKRFRVMGWKDKKYEPLKYAWAGKRSRLLYSAKSKVELAKRIIANHKRCLAFTVLNDVADELTEYTFHSKSEDTTLEQFINGDINKLTVCNMVNMGKLMPL